MTVRSEPLSESYVRLFVVVACTYAVGSEAAWGWFGGGTLGLSFFPSAGITLAAMLLTRRKYWISIVLAIVIAENAVNVRHGMPLIDSMGFALANVIEPLAGALAIQMLGRSRAKLDLRERGDVVRFMIGAILVAPITGGAIAATVKWTHGDGRWLNSLVHWWAGDGLGMLCVGAPIIAIVNHRAGNSHRWFGDTVLLAGISAVISVLIFRIWNDQSVAYLLLPALLIAAIRRNVFGLGVASLVSATVANLATAAGHGPFAAIDASPQAQLGFAQLFLASVTLTGWFFAVESNMRASAERRQAFEREGRVRAEGLLSTSHLSADLAVALDVADVVSVFQEHCATELQARFVWVRRFGPALVSHSAFALDNDAHPISLVPPDALDELDLSFSDGAAPQWAENVSEVEARFRPLRRRGVESVAIVPMRAIGGLSAVAVIGWDHPRSFDVGARAGLHAVCEIVGQALARAAAYADAEAARRRAERTALRLAELQRITVALSASMNSAEIAEIVAQDSAASLSCSLTAVTILDEEAGQLRTISGYGRRYVERWAKVSSSLETPAAEALRTRESVVVASSDELHARFPIASDIADGGEGSWVVIPLCVEDRGIGTLTFGFDQRQSFAAEDLGFMEAIAEQCAQFVQRVRQREAEHDAVLRLQRSLLPHQIASSESISVTASYRPAALAIGVGGDWYDTVELAQDCFMLIVGDVVGQGLPAALAMGQMRSAARALATRCEPAELLDGLDEFSQTIDGAFFTTVVCVLVDPMRGEIRYSVAGHPPPLLRRSNRLVRFLEGGRSTPIGISPGKRPEASEVIEMDDLVLLYTDGLVERRREPLDSGLQRAAAALSNADLAEPTWCERLIDLCVEGVEQRDDVAVLAASVRPMIPTVRIEVEPTINGVRHARLAVKRWLESLPLTAEDIADVILAVGEATTNSVLYAGQSANGSIVIQAVLRESSDLDVSVSDCGTWLDRPEDNPTTGGRGLAIIDQLMGLTIVKSNDGTVVRMRRHLSKAR